jgi:hypothetical protein
MAARRPINMGSGCTLIDLGVLKTPNYPTYKGCTNLISAYLENCYWIQ